MLQAGLTAVLNGPRDAEIWSTFDWRARLTGTQRPPAAVLQLDTGMSRLGFGARDWQHLLAETDFCDHFPMPMVIGHLGSGAHHDAPMIAQHPAGVQPRW